MLLSTLAIVLSTLQVITTVAQSSNGTTNVERPSIGISGALVLLMPVAVPSIRLSMPIGTRLGIDLDMGASAFWGDRAVGQVPRGLAITGQVRWLRNGRKPDGGGRYWLLSLLRLRGNDFEPDRLSSDRSAVENVQVGYGWDRVRNRVRFGAELSVGVAGRDGEGLARVFLVWGPK
jgi:hypothetical protein